MTRTFKLLNFLSSWNYECLRREVVSALVYYWEQEKTIRTDEEDQRWYQAIVDNFIMHGWLKETTANKLSTLLDCL